LLTGNDSGEAIIVAIASPGLRSLITT